MSPFFPTVQPANKGGVPAGRPTFRRGSKRSDYRLTQLGYDPIGELVGIYRKLADEVEYQEGLRSGAIVEIINGTGKERSYYAPTHHALFDQMISIGEKLLRYMYGRVPESNEEVRKKATAFVVNLTKQGEQYRLGSIDEEEVYEEI